jgi:hypothetical protein
MMEPVDLVALVNQILIILLLDGNHGLAQLTFKIKNVTVTNVIILPTNVCLQDHLEVVFLYQIVLTPVSLLLMSVTT